MTDTPHAPCPVESRYVTASDGLRLHVRDYGAHDSAATPVVCLPGLSRTANDFDRLARALASGAAGAPRRVLALDYRGRGLSDYDSNWRNYDLKVENADILACLTALEIGEAAFVGTSRGGLIVEADLEQALEEGLVSGAGIDVTMPEPPSADSVLMRMAKRPNVILTPHVAWASQQAMQFLADQLIDNIEAFVAHKPQHLVT